MSRNIPCPDPTTCSKQHSTCELVWGGETRLGIVPFMIDVASSNVHVFVCNQCTIYLTYNWSIFFPNQVFRINLGREMNKLGMRVEMKFGKRLCVAALTLPTVVSN